MNLESVGTVVPAFRSALAHTDDDRRFLGQRCDFRSTDGSDIYLLMPFDLYIGRASSLVSLRDGTPAPQLGFFSRVLGRGGAEATSPISREEFHGLMEGAPAQRRSTEHGDSTYWVNHREGDPWFVVEWRSPGYLVLSTSYTHHRFLRNLGDMFDQAMFLAESLNARVFEEVRGSEVKKSNIERLLDLKGDYLDLQAQTWRNTVEAFGEKVQAPLEFPLGPIDMVSEFLVFDLVPQHGRSVEETLTKLAECLPGYTAMKEKERVLSICDAADSAWLALIIQGTDGHWQVRPWHGRAPFSRVATTVLKIVQHLVEQQGGTVHFRGKTLTDELREEIASRANGLSVEFYLWVNQAPKS